VILLLAVCRQRDEAGRTQEIPEPAPGKDFVWDEDAPKSCGPADSVSTVLCRRLIQGASRLKTTAQAGRAHVGEATYLKTPENSLGGNDIMDSIDS